MLELALRGVRHNVGRYVATLIAIMTGVAFFSATGFLSDGVIQSLEGDANRQFGNVDVAIVPDDTSDSTNSDFLADLRISGASYDTIVATPGVEAAEGIVTGNVAFLAADGASTFGDGATGRLWVADDELNPLDLVDGAPPVAAGEIVVDVGLAEDEDLAIGQSVTLLTLSGPVDGIVVGTSSFGSSNSIDQNGTVSMSEASAFDWLTSGTREYEELYLRGTGSEADLVAAVEGSVPSGYVVQTGAEFLDDKRAETAGFGNFLKTALQIFALIAMFVGAFVIYNTFSVIVVQRLRELAVLAAIGATPKQIKRSLRFEGLLIGLVGSTLGVLVGFFLAFGLFALLEAFGIGLPGGSVAIKATNVISAVLLGTIITYLSVTIPARRAAKIEPIEALRVSAAESTSFSRRRVITCVALVGFGMLNILSGSGPAVGMGALLLFVGVIVSGPFIALFGSRLAKPLLSVLGIEGRLAADNGGRNPQRTATTANALLIGVFLVTLVTVAGSALRDFAVAELQKVESADFFIESTGGTIDDALIDDLLAIEDVEQVVAYRTESVTLDDQGSRVSTGDFAALSDVASLGLAEGSFDGLGPGMVLVPDSETFPHAVGDTVTVLDAAGDSLDLEVAGLLEASLDVSFVGALVSEESFDQLVGDTAPTVAFIDVASGTQEETEEAIEGITNLRPDISLIAGNLFADLVGGIFDFIINAVNGLLLMSVAVALIGIINTLSLSIIERRRELGLLRIIGMVDKRVQRMVQVESVLISALGTISGLVLGVFVGSALVLSIGGSSDVDIALSLPVPQLVAVLVLGIALGALASWIPSKRSTNLDVLEALEAG